jgi:replication initiation protein RepC
MIAAGIEEGVPADWRAFHAAYVALAARIPRTATRPELDPLAGELGSLADAIRILLETHVKAENMDANESRSGRHIQNSNPKPCTESELHTQQNHAPAVAPEPEPSRQPQRSFPLAMVLDACPDILPYARHGIGSWRDMIATAAFVRSMLGISPSAWEEAQAVLGPEDASVVVAAILQRAEAIKSAGGYLRSLTEKARGGAFSLGPVLMALIRTRRRECDRVA